jgi:hypothetical protein
VAEIQKASVLLVSELTVKVIAPELVIQMCRRQHLVGSFVKLAEWISPLPVSGHYSTEHGWSGSPLVMSEVGSIGPTVNNFIWKGEPGGRLSQFEQECPGHCVLLDETVMSTIGG